MDWPGGRDALDPHVHCFGSSECLGWLTKYLARFCTLQAVIIALIFSKLIGSLRAFIEVDSEGGAMNEFAPAIDSN